MQFMNKLNQWQGDHSAFRFTNFLNYLRQATLVWASHFRKYFVTAWAFSFMSSYENVHVYECGPGSSVGKATALQAGRSGDRIAVGGEIFRTCPGRPWGPPSLLYNGYRVFPGGKERPEIDADPSTPSSVVVKKEYSYTSTPHIGRMACTEPQCLYRASVPL
jgi:hypothetical protein